MRKEVADMKREEIEILQNNSSNPSQWGDLDYAKRYNFKLFLESGDGDSSFNFALINNITHRLQLPPIIKNESLCILELYSKNMPQCKKIWGIEILILSSLLVTIRHYNKNKNFNISYDISDTIDYLDINRQRLTKFLGILSRWCQDNYWKN